MEIFSTKIDFIICFLIKSLIQEQTDNLDWSFI